MSPRSFWSIKPVMTAMAGALIVAAAPMPMAPTTADFVKKAAISDMFEIQSSELAAIRADGPTRKFAAQMIEDHQKTSSELERLVKPHFEATPLPSQLDPEHKAKLDRLKQLDGTAFTAQYRSDQVGAHTAAVVLFDSYAQAGADEPLKAWASTTLPKLKAHLAMAQD